jgi:S-DNA-T family DNA segregation ATPase FtsK/SpoIIIE
MDVRISFRVKEQRDVDLILGQGMRNAGWQADKLNAPGKFLISAPEHDNPRRARAYLITDDDVREAVSRCTPARPELDPVSDEALFADQPPVGPEVADEDEPLAEDQHHNPDAILRRVLSDAPAEGIPVSDLIAATGMSRRWVFYRLRQLAGEGQAVQTVRGYWKST